MTKTIIRSIIKTCAVALGCMATALPALAEIKDPHGVPAVSANAQREVVLTSSTRHVNVVRNEIVRFTNPDNGKSFTWQFYTHQHPTIDIRTIAPAQFVDRDMAIYVAPSPDEQR